MNKLYITANVLLATFYITASQAIESRSCSSSYGKSGNYTETCTSGDKTETNKYSADGTLLETSITKNGSTSTTKYNYESGEIVSTVSSQDGGSEVVTSYTYIKDSDGKYESLTLESTDGTSTTYKYKYYDDGTYAKYIPTYTYSDEAQDFLEIGFSLDEAREMIDGPLYQEISFDIYNAINSGPAFELYDENDRLIQKTTMSRNEAQDEVYNYIYSYDDNGTLTAVTEFWPEQGGDDLHIQITYEDGKITGAYLGESGILTGGDEIRGNWENVGTFVYDEYGNLISSSIDLSKYAQYFGGNVTWFSSSTYEDPAYKNSLTQSSTSQITEETVFRIYNVEEAYAATSKGNNNSFSIRFK